MRLLSVGCIAATAASYASFAPTTAPRVGAPIHTALPDCGFRAVRQPLLRARRVDPRIPTSLWPRLLPITWS